MCFLAGPRQIGKTTLVKMHLNEIFQEDNYYNWDTITVKRSFAENPYFFIEPIPEPAAEHMSQPKYWVVFDEFHKYKNWKILLKGYYDELGHFIRFLVCGSARLDFFSRSGESLLGRYFLFRMFPLGPNDILYGRKFKYGTSILAGDENVELPAAGAAFREAVWELYNLTGFPEPFLKGEKTFYNRWQDAHFSLLTTEEVRDLTRVENIHRLQHLVFLLPERVGAPLSLNKLAQIISCSYNSVKLWLDALEKVYMVFRIPPYSLKLSRTLKKEQKLYFYDWGVLNDPGKRFENFVAVNLLRTISAWNEWGLGRFALFFVRTRDGREVDFLIARDLEPFILVETKYSEKELSPALLYFHERLKPGYSFQVSFLEENFLKQSRHGVFIIDAARFFKLLA